jgi:ATP phosphoribosyltransferase regulatory subunit
MKTTENRWLLPDGVQELLPPDAAAVESRRAALLALYDRWGYDLVMPAMMEFRDSLLTGTAHALEEKTFTLVDQCSGRLLGVRSDMTPQVARIDAHQLADQRPVSRLCYCGHLLHAKADGLDPNRSPLQIGAELFGHAGIEADIEIVSLMIETLQAIPLEQIALDLGHVGLFRGLFAASGLDAGIESRLFDMLQRKSIPELKRFLGELDLDEQRRRQFCQLALLNGGIEIIDAAREVFADAPADCLAALEQIETVARAVTARYPAVRIHCDLSELRGYDYHTGLVFAAFLPGQGREVARGGRYDAIGQVFGRARPATGFSTDLLALHGLSGQAPAIRTGILAPARGDDALQRLVAELRAAGERVVIDLSDGALPPEQQGCRQAIVRNGDRWVVNEV